MLQNNEIDIVFDEITRAYYVVWEPMKVIGSGKTKYGALQDMRKAAHFGVDSYVDSKLKNIYQEKED